MVVDRVYPCNINGKYYFKEVDFDQLINEQADAIIVALEQRLHDPSFKFYNDNSFQEYIESVRLGKISEILYPKEVAYRKQFDLAVLEYGSFEFVQRLFLTSDDEIKSQYLEELDKIIFDIQDILISFCQEQRVHRGVNYTTKMQKIYTNFLENFAPQRLMHYTTPPVNVNMISAMTVLKDESLKSLTEAETYKMTDKFTDFNSLYRLDLIMRIVNIYMQLAVESDLNKKNNLALMVDDLTKECVVLNGNNKALMNLANPTCSQTINQAIDGIVIRLNHYENNENIDISEDFQLILDKYIGIKDVCSLEQLYYRDMTLYKLLQLAHLDILPKKEKELLNDYLDKEFGRNTIDDIDMSKYDSKIENNEQFSEQEVKEFYKDVMKITIKKGQMPVKYNEFLMSKLIEENPEFSNNLDNIQRILIIEQFASIKSEQLVGKKNFITFSTNFFDKEDGTITLGEHQPGFIKLRTISAPTQSMEMVLNIVTILHELRHEQQHIDINSKKYDHLKYMMEKEMVFRKKDYHYYNRNYNNIYIELDAEYFSLNKSLNFLKTLPLNQQFLESTQWKEIIETLENRLKTTEQGFDKAKSKEIKDGKMVNVEEAFDKLILENPEIIKTKPIFRVEYNEDGSRKSIKQIFEEFTDIIRVKENRQDNYDLYKYILFTRAGRDSEKCLELSDVEIPPDLSDSTKAVLEKLRYAILNRERQKTISELEFVNNNDNIDIKTEEVMTDKSKKKYDEIFGSEER